MKALFNDEKIVKLQTDLQDHLETNTSLSDSQIARAKKIARNGRDAVVSDNGSVMDASYHV